MIEVMAGIRRIGVAFELYNQRSPLHHQPHNQGQIHPEGDVGLHRPHWIVPSRSATVRFDRIDHSFAFPHPAEFLLPPEEEFPGVGNVGRVCRSVAWIFSPRQPDRLKRNFQSFPCQMEISLFGPCPGMVFWPLERIAPEFGSSFPIGRFFCIFCLLALPWLVFEKKENSSPSNITAPSGQ